MLPALILSLQTTLVRLMSGFLLQISLTQPPGEGIFKSSQSEVTIHFKPGQVSQTFPNIETVFSFTGSISP